MTTKQQEVPDKRPRTLTQRASTAGRAYQSIRVDMPAGRERTAKMEVMFEGFKTDACLPELDPEDVLSLLWTGSAGARGGRLRFFRSGPNS